MTVESVELHVERHSFRKDFQWNGSVVKVSEKEKRRVQLRACVKELERKMKCTDNFGPQIALC
jgi:hypothetical protein